MAIGAGAHLGRHPGVLKARFGSHEVINTIMLNFIAMALVSYFTQYHYGFPATRSCRPRRSRSRRSCGVSATSFRAFRAVSR